MPPWTVGELPEAPKFRWSQLALMVGPGLVMGGAAIGGGEWLTGPLVTARYGASLLWLATLSVLFQVIYNVEISRYTLYSGEPIFTGKFRIPPNPLFWVIMYLILDLGSVLPYLASNAAIPLGAIIRGKIPDKNLAADRELLQILSCTIFVLGFLPLCIGGRVYRSIKVMMTFKLVVVLTFLTFLAVCYSTRDTWKEILSGFFEFGNVPVVPAEDWNKNGIQDPGEAIHGPNVENVFSAWRAGRPIAFDFAIIGFLASMAAISGNGGLTNTPISSFTREQGWGMGKHVGAIPSMVGGHEIELSHSGKVFRITESALKRWQGWIAHVEREQYIVWLPACFVGIALPSMLSIVFLARRTVLADKWQAAGMTADGVRNAIAESTSAGIGNVFWYLTLLCGLLILSTSMVTTADGFLRRWVDMFWTSSKRLHAWDPGRIRHLYFGVLVAYVISGVIMLIYVPGDTLLVTATGMMYNYALGVSCVHTLVINTILLPKELQPRLWQKIGLVLGAVFFISIGVMTTVDEVGKLRAKWAKEAEKALEAPQANPAAAR
ncbi:MAG: Nramp family divalent metal transporter [Planctomycetota bacterium]